MKIFFYFLAGVSAALFVVSSLSAALLLAYGFYVDGAALSMLGLLNGFNMVHIKNLARNTE